MVNYMHAPRSDELGDKQEDGDGQHDILDEKTVRKLNAVYLLGTKETHKLSQRTAIYIIN